MTKLNKFNFVLLIILFNFISLVFSADISSKHTKLLQENITIEVWGVDLKTLSELIYSQTGFTIKPLISIEDSKKIYFPIGDVSLEVILESLSRLSNSYYIILSQQKSIYLTRDYHWLSKISKTSAEFINFSSLNNSSISHNDLSEVTKVINFLDPDSYYFTIENVPSKDNSPLFRIVSIAPSQLNYFLRQVINTLQSPQKKIFSLLNFSTSMSPADSFNSFSRLLNRDVFISQTNISLSKLTTEIYQQSSIALLFENFSSNDPVINILSKNLNIQKLLHIFSQDLHFSHIISSSPQLFILYPGDSFSLTPSYISRRLYWEELELKIYNLPKSNLNEIEILQQLSTIIPPHIFHSPTTFFLLDLTQGVAIILLPSDMHILLGS